MPCKTILLVSNITQSFWIYRRDLIRHLIDQGYTVHCAAADDDFREKVQSLGVIWHPIPLHRSSTNPIKEIKTLLSILALIRKIKPSAIFTFTIKPNSYVPIFARLMGIPCISIVTGLGYSFLSKSIQAKIAKWVFILGLSLSNKIWVYNTNDQDDLTACFPVIKSKISLIPGSGMDVHSFFDSPKLPLSDTALSFLMISRLLIDKGIREYIRAAEIVRQSYPDATFHILGPLDPDNPACLSKLELDDAVQKKTIIHHPATQDVRPYIQEADCIVLPSYREGIPKVLLEAGAMSRPAITTTAPGCRDVIQNGLNGLTVPARDAEALANAIITFIKMDPDHRVIMAQNAREHIIHHFSNETVFQTYDTALDHIFKKRKQA